MKKLTISILGIALAIALSSCQSKPKMDTKTNLTFGAVKSRIVKGQTTQSEIISLLGSPNITSKNREGNEVWTYAKQSSRQEDTKATMGGGLLGTGAILGGLFGGASKAVSTTSVNTFDLIIIFDQSDIVKDYSVIASKF